MHLETSLRAAITPCLAINELRPRCSRGPKDAALISALSIVAHDLRGPLANLAVLLELIESFTQMEAYDRIEGAARKAQSLIDALSGMLNGFLERVRETGDPLAFRPAMVDLADVVAGAIALNQPIADSRSITIASDCQPLAAKGDQLLLIEALDNLIGNAVKHSPRGSIVRCVIERRGSNAIIRVIDEGQGLSELDLKRAFNPFASLGSKAPGASFGLGLWIVRLIAERHGGRAEVRHLGPGRGACFEISLPAGLARQRRA